MNKAFVKEPEFDGRAFCPQCGQLGVAVRGVTLDAFIRPESRDEIGVDAWFCGYDRCAVAYFDLFETTVTADKLVRTVYPKDSRAPLCGCFGLQVSDIEADVTDGHPTRLRVLAAQSKSPEADCQVKSPDGRCCMQEAQRIYFRLKGE
tara:strand:- start:200 stop:643 length:444 start_codon:yes stop_codon:yes gene_type:complete